MDKNKLDLQNKVIEAGKAVCDNAAFLPDGNAQVPSELCNALGDSLCVLADFEREEYADYLFPLEEPIWGFTHQQGLNAAQVALLRLEMPEDQLRTERLVDGADQLYLAIFDKVVIPGAYYISLSTEEVRESQYIHQYAIENFQNLL